MQTFTPAAANTLWADMVARLDGSPITSGTVTFYLRALTGDNAGKWWRASDTSWQATEESAGAGTHRADGMWDVSIVAGAWVDGDRYVVYAKESGDLHIPYTEECLNLTADSVSNITTEATVTR